MVYVALDSSGGAEAARVALACGASLWVGADVFTPAEQQQLRAGGLSLTVFSYSLRSASPEALAGALATIDEHHPGELIWVQHVYE